MKINDLILKSITKHSRNLDLKNFFLLSSMRYERCAEFPLIIEEIKPLFERDIKYLDIGTGDSALPSYIFKNSNWDITCVDKFSWVKMQEKFINKISRNGKSERFKIILNDFMNVDFPKESFDIITNISVIEHFENNSDSLAMRKSAALLKKGGLYILTTPYNEGNFREFFLNKEVYGKSSETEPVFFQRHYDKDSFQKRIIEPSGLVEIERKFFGEYGFQFKEIFIDLPLVIKPIKIIYQWLIPQFAKRFISIKDIPVSRNKMKMYTSAGIFVVLKKI